SAIAAWSGRCSRHSASSASTLPPAASTEARIRCGWRAITSSAEAPIEPVAPSTAMERGVSTCAARSEAEPDLADREHRKRRQHAVDAVEPAAVAGDPAARAVGPAPAPGQALAHLPG